MESRFEEGMRVRREVLGAEHVARAQARHTTLDADFQLGGPGGHGLAPSP